MEILSEILQSLVKIHEDLNLELWASDNTHNSERGKENKDTYDLEGIIDSIQNVVHNNLEVGHFKTSIENADLSITIPY